MTINGVNYNVPQPTDGIALSDDANTLYYSSLSREMVYSLSTELLQDFKLPNSQISPFVKYLGVKGYSDGMTYNNNGTLFFGDLEHNAVKCWETTLPVSYAQILVNNSDSMQWQDTFAWDASGYLYFVSNKLQKFFYGGMKWDGSDGANFRVWKVFVNSKSYLSGNPKPPSRPCQQQ